MGQGCLGKGGGGDDEKTDNAEVLPEVHDENVGMIFCFCLLRFHCNFCLSVAARTIV